MEAPLFDIVDRQEKAEPPMAASARRRAYRLRGSRGVKFRENALCSEIPSRAKGLAEVSMLERRLFSVMPEYPPILLTGNGNRGDAYV